MKFSIIVFRRLLSIKILFELEFVILNYFKTASK